MTQPHNHTTSARTRFAALAAMVLATIFIVACVNNTDDNVINGIHVPPAPDPSANKATVAGVDSDQDGVRDDVQRFIAEQFGTDPAKYSEMISLARSEQAAIVSPTPENVAKYLAQIGCISDHDILMGSKSVTTQLLDTPARSAAYVNAFAGGVLTSEGCPK